MYTKVIVRLKLRIRKMMLMMMMMVVARVVQPAKQR